MRSSQTVTIEVLEQTWGCDFCDFKLVSRAAGFQRGMFNCHVCKKDMCGKHARWFFEHTDSDYADAIVCTDCGPRFEEAWEWGKENAGRYESLIAVVDKRLAQRTGAEP